MSGPDRAGEFAFGDYEAEDAWDAGDPPAAHVHNLAERVAALADHLPFDGVIDETAPDVLEEIAAAAEFAGRLADDDDGEDRRHVAGILEDLATVRAERGES